ncbi:MAG TPA: DUF5696 domain-containing protein [Candidatus Hydrogenedens sp.]|nr:DUF5696 domain-containing protein [Candidatus Hydrogenedens sp.]
MKKIYFLFYVFLVFATVFTVNAQNIESRKEKYLYFLNSLNNIPVDNTLTQEKTAKIETLKSKISNISTEADFEGIYKEFTEVREWLLKNAVEKPSLSSETFSENTDFWILENSKTRVQLSKKDLQLIVDYQGQKWEFYPSDDRDIILALTTLSLVSAKEITCEEITMGYAKGFTLQFKDFPSAPNFTIFITFYLADNKLTIDIVSSSIVRQLREIQFPKPVQLNPSPDEKSVLCVMQGMLLPANYAGKFYGKEPANSRMMYMPWWGHIKGNSGLLAIFATSDDAGIEYQHPEGGPTRVQPVWYSSLGELGYLRSIEYYFFPQANHTTLAKGYRNWVKENKNFVTIKEKIARCPLLEKIIGVPVIHVGALYHFEESSHYFNKEIPENNHSLVLYSKIAEQLRELKNKGMDSAYVHLDGWGFLGYDSGHPDIIPPGYEAGGLEGLKQLSRTCKELGYIFALHDQYRDLYLNAVSFNPKLAVLNQAKVREQHSIWCGGPQMFLSPRFVPSYVQRNHNWLISNGVEIQGVYLDVFSVVPLEESYESFAPVTRSECGEYRKEAFRFLKSKGYIISSEEPTDYFVSVIDLVHHGPYWLRPSLDNGESIGIPIPLFNLVYHDSLIMPWSITEDGGWGIPKGDAGYLHCILNAGMPYLNISADEKEISRIKELCSIAKHCQFLELVNHEFLDDTYRKQKTTYSDGTTIIVDFDNKTYEVKYPEK